jgi:hypothetical protein
MPAPAILKHHHTLSCNACSPLGLSCRFHYTMMAWLPSYFADTLSLNLTQAAQLSLLPPVAAIVASSIAGTAGDALISKGMPVVQVRKLAQCTAFLGPALCLAGASLTDDSHLKVGGCLSFDLAALQVWLGQACICRARSWCAVQDVRCACSPACLPSACLAAAEMARMLCCTVCMCVVVDEGALTLLAFAQRVSTGKACITSRLLLH